MALLNYTTEVSAPRTIGQITEILIAAGARKIGTEYNGTGHATGVSFAMDTPYGMRYFTLPVDASRVLIALRREKVPPRYQNHDQAERVAWRIVKDWLEAQLALIKINLASVEQVMLPYMHAEDGRTMFEVYVDQQPALGVGSA